MKYMIEIFEDVEYIVMLFGFCVIMFYEYLYVFKDDLKWVKCV